MTNLLDMLRQSQASIWAPLGKPSRWVAMFHFPSRIGGVDSTEIQYIARVQIENQLERIHCDADTPLAMLPIGVIAESTDYALGWNDAIGDGLGDDRYSYDRDDHAVSETADGLPEISVVIDVAADANGRIVSDGQFDADSLTSIVLTMFAGGVMFIRRKR